MGNPVVRCAVAAAGKGNFQLRGSVNTCLPFKCSSASCMYLVLHAPEFNSFYHIKTDWNIVKILDLVLTHNVISKNNIKIVVKRPSELYA